MADPARRITQVLVESDLLNEDQEHRFTQVLIEADYIDRQALRVTQALIEVDYVELPAPPTPDPEPPEEPARCTREELEGQYLIQLLDHDGGAVSLLYPYTKLTYTRAINGLGHHGWGSYEVQMEANQEAVNLFALDYIVSVRRKIPGGDWRTEFEGLHRISRFFFDNEDKEHFVSSGGELPTLLQRPTIQPDTGSAFFLREEPFTDIMVDLVDYNMGPNAAVDRQFANVAVMAKTGQGDTVRYGRRQIKVYEALEELAGLGADFTLEREDDTITFHVYYPRYGQDRRIDNTRGNTPVVFSIERQNMRLPQFTRDRSSEKTVAYVAGEGVGVTQEIVERTSLWGAEHDSPWNRIEEFVPTSQFTETAGLMAVGDGYLAENRELVSFDFEAIPTPGCLYGVHWDLGDLVTGRYRGVNMDMRVVEVQVVLDDLGEHIYPTVMYIPENLLWDLYP